mmetsp:Transcript_5493/g.7552  ORF Transcript_5493/g.7552 Transcript_5493/m.7552 type:complete len:349 (+) Transcript_5493:31-1077(+)
MHTEEANKRKASLKMPNAEILFEEDDIIPQQDLQDPKSSKKMGMESEVHGNDNNKHLLAAADKTVVKQSCFEKKDQEIDAPTCTVDEGKAPINRSISQKIRGGLLALGLKCKNFDSSDGGDDLDIDEAIENKLNAAWTIMAFAIYSKHYLVFTQMLCSVVARLLLFSGLVISRFKILTQLCPMSYAESDALFVGFVDDAKIVYLGICILYTGRLLLHFVDVTYNEDVSSKNPTVPQLLDSVSKTIFNNAVYLFNTVVVANSENVPEMILNSIAMEFLVQLDDEVKGRVLTTNFGEDFKKDFHGYIKKSKKVPKWILWPVEGLETLVVVLSPLGFLFVGIYGLFCHRID